MGLVEQGSSSEVGLVPDAICGRGGSVTGGVIELDFAQSKAAYLPYAASTPTHSVRPCARPVPRRVCYSCKSLYFPRHDEEHMLS